MRQVQLELLVLRARLVLQVLQVLQVRLVLRVQQVQQVHPLRARQE